MRDPALDDGHHLARGAVANAIVVAVANLRGIFDFLIARLLGEAVFGRYGLAWTATELLSKVGVLGLDSGVTPLLAPHAVSEDRDACRRIFRRAAWTAGITSILIALAGLALATLSPRARALDAVAGGGALMLLALPAISISRISASTSRSLLAMRNEFYARSLTETWVTIAAFAIAVALGLRNSAPALAVVAGTSAAAAVAVALTVRTLRGPSPADSRARGFHGGPVPSTAAMVRFSWPLAVANLLTVLITQADVLLLGAFVGRAPGVTPESFGVYCACSRLAIGMRKVRQIVEPIFAPVVARRSASDERAWLRETVAPPARWLLAVELPYVGTLVLSGIAVLNVYGDGFREGAFWLALLSAAHGANIFAGLAETLLMFERPRLNLANTVVTAGVQTAASLVLIPRFGITGAAVAMCVGLGGQSVMRFVQLRQVCGWTWPWSSLRRPVAAFAIAFTPAALMRLLSSGLPMEILSGVGFLALYLTAWWVIGPEPVDRELWVRLRRSNWIRRRAG